MDAILYVQKNSQIFSQRSRPDIFLSLGHNIASEGNPCYFRNSTLTLFVCSGSLRPINNLSVKQGRVFLG